MTTSAFVLRLTWDSHAEGWCIVLKPTDGAPPCYFGDLETAFVYLARHYTDQEYLKLRNAEKELK